MIVFAYYIANQAALQALAGNYYKCIVIALFCGFTIYQTVVNLHKLLRFNDLSIDILNFVVESMTFGVTTSLTFIARQSDNTTSHTGDSGALGNRQRTLDQNDVLDDVEQGFVNK